LVESSFQLEVRNEERAAVIVLSGELDLASAPALEEELERATANGAKLIILDMRELRFIDSTGLSLLIKAHRQAEASGYQFAVVRGRRQVQRLLGLTGIEDRITVIDSPDELLATPGD
jgi:anti-anti-sigma factor